MRIARPFIIIGALVFVVVAIAGYSAFQRSRLVSREEVEMAGVLATWKFDQNDPNLREARFLGSNGTSVSLGFATVVTRGGEQFIAFPPTNATFLDMGAQQIHMASKPDATISDIPLGSAVKVRVLVGSTVDSNALYIYDILVVQ